MAGSYAIEGLGLSRHLPHQLLSVQHEVMSVGPLIQVVHGFLKPVVLDRTTMPGVLAADDSSRCHVAESNP